MAISYGFKVGKHYRYEGIDYKCATIIAGIATFKSDKLKREQVCFTYDAQGLFIEIKTKPNMITYWK